MIYVYIALICLGVNVSFCVGLVALIRWAIPRYGAKAMALAMQPRPPFAPSTVAPARKQP